MHSGRGNVVGPDLSAVGGRDDAAWLLQSILQPSREVAPQFFPTALELKDGTEFLGIKLRKGGGGKEFYRDLTGRERTISTADVVGRHDLTTSLMPEGLLATLTRREIRDLLAFLGQRGIPEPRR
jgi:putative heme-binding domain-containing protein